MWLQSLVERRQLYPHGVASFGDFLLTLFEIFQLGIESGEGFRQVVAQGGGLDSLGGH